MRNITSLMHSKLINNDNSWGWLVVLLLVFTGHPLIAFFLALAIL